MNKKPIWILAAVLLCITTLYSCTKTDITPQPAGSDHISSEKTGQEAGLTAKGDNGNTIVSGGGKYEDEQFSVHAIQKKDGSVSGKLVYHSPELNFQGEITCINSGSFTIGKQAILTGVITKVEASEFLSDAYYVGAWFEFIVQDRGEGNNASSDMVKGPINRLGDADCFRPTLFDWPLIPLTSGNIQIKLASE